eukprot:TRINITY_DN13263_c0_g1_i8.p1 TRINITY_DN13263_c0_g1~~TRINITY_DN13263_c0_g1_i8.p1  ORF type:complete len:103 (-),score=9.89 TRINITY_DN13263_c0_g1_i8:893-1201(-)
MPHRREWSWLSRSTAIAWEASPDFSQHAPPDQAQWVQREVFAQSWGHSVGEEVALLSSWPGNSLRFHVAYPQLLAPDPVLVATCHNNCGHNSLKRNCAFSID